MTTPCFLTAELPTVKKDRRRSRFSALKPKRQANHLRLTKNGYKGTFILPRLKGISVCLAKNGLLFDEKRQGWLRTAAKHPTGRPLNH